MPSSTECTCSRQPKAAQRLPQAAAFWTRSSFQGTRIWGMSSFRPRCTASNWVSWRLRRHENCNPADWICLSRVMTNAIHPACEQTTSLTGSIFGPVSRLRSLTFRSLHRHHNDLDYYSNRTLQNRFMTTPLVPHVGTSHSDRLPANLLTTCFPVLPLRCQMPRRMRDYRKGHPLRPHTNPNHQPHPAIPDRG